MQRNTGYFPTESLEPCGNRLFSRSALNEGYLFRGSLDLLLNTPVFTGFHKVHTEQMQAGTTSSASSGEKWVRQSQRPVVFE